MIPLSFPVNSFYIATLFYLASLVFYSLSGKRPALSFLGLGLFVNLISEISGRLLTWPYCNMFSEPFFLPLCISAISFLLIILRREREGLAIVPIIVLFSFIAIFFSESYYPPFTIMSRSIHSHLFHLFAFISHACFLSGAYIAALLVFKKRRDDISHRIIIWGFALSCMAGFFGMIWSYLGRSDIVSWNHYYFHSIALWLYYAGFLHLHMTKRWGRKKRVWILMAGFLLIFYFDYLPQIGGMHMPGILDVELY